VDDAPPVLAVPLPEDGPELLLSVEGAAAAGAEVAAVAPAAAVSELPGVAFPEPAAGALAPPEPPRKSVTYQPEPLSWKPAAVTCLLKVSAPQAGQVVKGASDIFCKASLAWPQALQR